jgi:ribosomal protein S18 acetylase RimI-like enzyme
VWRALDPPPFIYWTAITLRRDAPVSLVHDARGTICDSWSVLELEPFGFEERMREPWFIRPAAPLPAEDVPPELEVVEVSTPGDVAEFELVSARGFGGEDATVETPFHPPAILADARMRMLTGRVDGSAVAAAMGYGGEGAVGIYGVTTIASARGRGYASTLTRALIDPERSSILSSSPEAERLYRRLGFERVGELRQWTSGAADFEES